MSLTGNNTLIVASLFLPVTVRIKETTNISNHDISKQAIYNTISSDQSNLNTLKTKQDLLHYLPNTNISIESNQRGSIINDPRFLTGIERPTLFRSLSSSHLPNSTLETDSISMDREFSFHTSTLRNGGLHNALLSAAPKLPNRTLVGTLGIPSDQFTPTEMIKIERALSEGEEDRWGTVKIVWTNHEQIQGHYNQFCKQTLWPMFHYVLPEYPTSQGWEKYAWDKCVEVNELFAKMIISIYKPGDIIWVNDYHLMLLPAMLRRRLPNAIIGFFLHVPFPSSEIFRCLHRRREILEGVLGANMIGFQTYSYARHFLQTCTRVLRVETTPTCVELDEYQVQVGIFPIGK
jgi:trehalose-6-phosphate synthase